MSEGILKFRLPDERSEHSVAVNAMDWALTVSNLDEWIGDKLHHGHKFKSADKALEAVRTELHEELISRNLLLDMIE